MAACVIPFPASPAAAKPDPYAVFQARVAEIFASEADEQGLTKPPKALRHEDEILRRLRRIERLLSQLDVARGAGRAAGSSGAAAMPL